jgi:hypothetical protein
MRPLHDALPQDACPWVFATRFEGINEAHVALRKLGIPAATWGSVRPPDICSEHFPEALELYDNLVFLPVHQSLGHRQLSAIAAAMLQVARSAA